MTAAAPPPRTAPRVRSALFVPGSRGDLLERAHERGADALLVDLEDSVVADQLDAARARVGAWIRDRPATGHPVACVRIRPLDEGQLDDDLDAVVHPGLTAVLVPKVVHEDDVVRVAEALAFHEGRRGLARGAVRIWPLVETAVAIQRSDRIARASERIAYMGGGTSRQGDIARALGFRWSAGGEETLYLRSKVLVDVRAAEVPNPISGLVSTLDGTADLEAFARQSRALGYEGVMVIHPSQVPLVNAVFSPTDEERRDAREVLAALADAEARGLGAITHRGRMIDRANIETIHALGLADEAADDGGGAS
jgi:citrate lyase subunit beta / citryl-CoA lyase